MAEYIRNLGGPDGKLFVDKLFTIAYHKSTDPALTYKILNTLLDRGYGAIPKVLDMDIQAQVKTNTTVRLDQLSDEELDRLETILRKAEDRTIDAQVIPRLTENVNPSNHSEKCEVATGGNNGTKAD